MPLEEGDTFFFAPRPLRNLVLVDELDSLSPILACQVADLGKHDCDTKLSMFVTDIDGEKWQITVDDDMHVVRVYDLRKIIFEGLSCVKLRHVSYFFMC